MTCGQEVHMRTALTVLTLVVSCSTLAQAQTAEPPRRGHPVIWTTVGAAAGFSFGLWLGLAAFDDDVNSESKVWATAVATGAASGIAAYLLDRRASRPRPTSASRPSVGPRSALSDAEVQALSRTFRLGGGARLARQHPQP
jgi:hypothetical protein